MKMYSYEETTQNKATMINDNDLARKFDFSRYFKGYKHERRDKSLGSKWADRQYALETFWEIEIFKHRNFIHKLPKINIMKQGKSIKQAGELQLFGMSTTTVAQMIKKELTTVITNRITQQYGSQITAVKTILWSQVAIGILQILINVIALIRKGFDTSHILLMVTSICNIVMSLFLALKITEVDPNGMVELFQTVITDMMNNKLNRKNGIYEEDDDNVIPCGPNATNTPVILSREEVEASRVRPKSNAERRAPFGTRTTSMKQGLSFETILSLAIGGISVALAVSSMCGMTKAVDIMRNFNVSSTFRKNLQSSVGDVRSMVESIADEAFNVQISRDSRTLNEIRNIIAELDSYALYHIVDFQKNSNLYYTYRKHILAAQEILLTTKFIAKNGNISSIMQVLNAAFLSSKDRFNKIGQALRQSGKRQETVLLHLWGDAGAGKTHLTLNKLLPDIAAAMGIKNTYYSINFAGQPEFWPPYGGEEMGVYDEFLAMKENDPIIPHINVIGSQGWANFPGADILYKQQPCNLKLLVLISNQPYINLRSVLTAEAERAFYSRLHCYQIKNTSIVPGISRDDIRHTESMEELQFMRHEGNAVDRHNAAELTQVTYEQLVCDVADLMARKFFEFKPEPFDGVATLGKKVVDAYGNSRDIETEDEGEEEPIVSTKQGQRLNDNFACCIFGEPGTGKSTRASEIGFELHRLLKMPLYELKNEDLNERRNYPEPSIFVLHDKLTDETKYLQWYDALPVPSIIINTANFTIHKKRTFSRKGEVSPGKGVVDSLINHATNLCNSIMVPNYDISGYNQVNPEPGFIRRIGLTGPLFHSGQSSWRSEDIGQVFVASRGYLFSEYGKEESISATDMTDIIFRKYLKMRKRSTGVEIRQVENFSIQTDFDVELQCKDIAELKNTVNNSVQVLQAFRNGLDTTDPTKPFIKISKRTRNSNFHFSANMFHIDDVTTYQGIVDVAQRSYAALTTANADFSVLIKAQPFEARAHGGVIEWMYAGNAPMHVWEYEIVKHPNQPAEVLLIKKNVDGEIIQGISMSARDVVYGLENGFTLPEFSEITTEALSYLHTVKDTLLKENELNALRRTVKVETFIGAHITDEKIVTGAAWLQFLKSKTFTIIIVLITILMTLVGVSSILGIVKFFQTPSSKVELTLPKNIKYCDEYLSLTYQLKNGMVEVEIDGPAESAEIVIPEIQNQLDRLNREHNTSVEIGTVSFKQGDYLRAGKRPGKTTEHKKAQLANKLRLSRSTKQALDDGSPASQERLFLLHKVLKNQIYIRGSKAACYGLGIRDTYAVTPAHIWRDVGDTGFATKNVNKMTKDKDGNQILVDELVSYQAVVRAFEPERDVAIIQLMKTDKTILENFKDITKYFHLEKDQHKLYKAALVRRGIDPSPNALRENIFILTGHALRRDYMTWDDKALPGISYYFQRWASYKIPFSNGDCGALLFADDVSVGASFLMGMHVGICERSRGSESSVISRDFLDATLTAIDNCKQGDIKLPPIEEQQWASVTLDYHPDFPTDPILCGPRDVKFIQAVEELVDTDQDEIWYDAESYPDNKLAPVGWHPKLGLAESTKHSYFEAPWYDSEEFEDCLDEFEATPYEPSIIHLKQLSEEELAAVPTMGGKKQLLAREIMNYNDILQWDSINEHLLDQATSILLPHYLRLYGEPFKHRPLGMAEVFNGLNVDPRNPLFEGLEGLDVNTSAGFYAKHHWGITTKAGLFRKSSDKTPTGKDMYEWDIHPAAQDVRKQVEDTIHLARTGIRKFTVVQDNLKREVTKAGKSRAFQSMDLAEVFLIRKYFGTFMGAVKLQRAEGHCQLGIDPLIGFNQLFKRFRRIGIRGEAGDFKRWDKHMTQRMIYAGVDVMVRVITSKMDAMMRTEYENVAKIIKQMICHSFVVCGKVCYIKTTGNPSGNVLTTVLNSIVNDLYHAMFCVWAVKEAKKDIAELSKEEFVSLYQLNPSEYPHVKNLTAKMTPLEVVNSTDWIDYGDDFLSVVSDEYLWLVNFSRKQKFFQERLSILYDTPYKDGKTYHTKFIYELNFLSRDFYLDEDTQLIIPKLKKESIESLFRWTQNTNPNDLAQQVGDAVNEAVLHGEDYYNKILWFVECVAKYFRTAYGHDLPITPLLYDAHIERVEQQIRNGSRSGFSPENRQKEVERKVDKSCVRNTLRPRIEPITFSIEYLNTLSAKQGKMTSSAMEILIDHCLGVEQHMCENPSYPLLKGRMRAHPALESTIEGIDYVSWGVNPPPGENNPTSLQLTKYKAEMCKLLASIYKDIPYEIMRFSSVHSLCIKLPDGRIQNIYQYKLLLTKQWEVEMANFHFPRKNNLFALPPLSTRLRKTTIPLQGVEASTKQATGTENTGKGGTMFVNHDRDFPEDGVAASKVSGILPGTIKATPYDLDVREQAGTFTWVETVDITMGTVPGTVVWKAYYADMEKWSIPMKQYGGIHEAMACPVEYMLTFVTASTVVNQLRMGYTTVDRSVYTPDMLGLISSADVTVSNDVMTAELRNSATSYNSLGEGVLLNRRKITNGITGLQTQHPMLVLLSMTDVQNAILNDSLTINVIVSARFKYFDNIPSFIYSAVSLEMGRTLEGRNSPVGNRILMSELLRLPPARPFYITLDGDKTNTLRPSNFNPMISNHSLVRPSKIAFSNQLTFRLVRAAVEPDDILEEHATMWHEGMETFIRRDMVVDSRCGALFFCPDKIIIPIYDNATQEFRDIKFYTTKLGFLMARVQTHRPTEREAAHRLLVSAAVDPVTQSWEESASYAIFNNTVYWRQRTNTYAPRFSLIVTPISGNVSGLPSMQVKDYEMPAEMTIAEFYEEFEKVYTGKLLADGFNYQTMRFANTDFNEVMMMQAEGNDFVPSKYNIEGSLCQIRAKDPVMTRVAQPHMRIIRIWKEDMDGIFLMTVHENTVKELTHQPTTSQTGYRFREDWSTLPYGQTTVGHWKRTNQLRDVGHWVMTQTETCYFQIEPTDEFSLEYPMIIENVEMRERPITVDPIFSVLEMGVMLPPTLTSAMAASGAPTMMRDHLFMSNFESYLRTLKVDIGNENVSFQLTNQMGLSVIATVFYDTTTKTFLIKHTSGNHSDHENYLAYPKLAAEEIVIANVQVLSHGQIVAATTNTSGWNNRVVDTSSTAVYDGRRIVTTLYDMRKFLSTRNFKTVKKQGASLGIAALQGAGGAASGVGNSLFQQLMQDKLFAHLSEQQKAAFAQQLEMLAKGHELDMEKLQQQLANTKDLEEHKLNLASGYLGNSQQARFGNSTSLGDGDKIHPPNIPSRDISEIPLHTYKNFITSGFVQPPGSISKPVEAEGEPEGGNAALLQRELAPPLNVPTPAAPADTAADVEDFLKKPPPSNPKANVLTGNFLENARILTEALNPHVINTRGEPEVGGGLRVLPGTQSFYHNARETSRVDARLHAPDWERNHVMNGGLHPNRAIRVARRFLNKPNFDTTILGKS